MLFEITDYQGSVRAVVTGTKDADGNAQIVSLTDYYAFGSVARKYQPIEAPQYGFHGMKRDNQVGNDDEDYTTEFRQYDSDLGRWLTPDPLMAMFADETPYMFCSNNPVNFTDVLGLADDGKTVGNGATRTTQNVSTKRSNGGAKKAGSNKTPKDIAARQAQQVNNAKKQAEKVLNKANNFAPKASNKTYQLVTSTTWQDLTKAILYDYVKTTFCPTCSDGKTEQMTGEKFESAWHNAAQQMLGADERYTINKDKYKTGNVRKKHDNYVPDAIVKNTYALHWIEVKAKSGTLYKSTDDRQVLGMIHALSMTITNSENKLITFVTTSNVILSPGIEKAAEIKKIKVTQIVAQYRIGSNGVMYVRFLMKSTFFFGLFSSYTELNAEVKLE